MFVLSKGKPKTANLITDRPNKTTGELIRGTHRQPDGSLRPKTGVMKGMKRTTSKYGVRSNIWTYAGGYGRTTNDHFAFRHPAVAPEKLVEDHILTWSEPGDLVLDPFIGSGTTAKMALLNNRHFLGCEIDSQYYGIALRRISTAREARKVKGMETKNQPTLMVSSRQKQTMNCPAVRPRGSLETRNVLSPANEGQTKWFASPKRGINSFWSYFWRYMPQLFPLE